VVGDGSNSYLYIDGSLVATGSAFTFTPTALSIGNSLTSGTPNSEGFNGAIDEVCIYNRALSAQEVYHLYKSGK
jgi:hypothetical protein